MKRSLTEVISESDFLALVEQHARNFLRIYYLLRQGGRPFTRRFYAGLIQESEELESFLDDHGARDNKTWHLFGELVASIRNLSKAAFILKHIIQRYPIYELNDGLETYLEDVHNVSALIDKTIFALFDEIRAESLNLGLPFPGEPTRDNFVHEIYPQKRLPYTIDEEDDVDGKKVAARIATQYLKVIERFQCFGWNLGKQSPADLRKLVPLKVNEERARELTALIHNLQSTYDHYIKRSPLEGQDPHLRKLRGYISLPLHLLSVADWLSHLYQRHIAPEGPGKAADRISSVIDGDTVLNMVINFALYYSDLYLQAGKKIAGGLLARYVEIDSCELNVPEKLGFHLRPATLVAKLAAHYGTRLSLVVDGREFDAGSVLNITLAAGLIARKGYKKVLFKGDRRILQDLKILSECNYGEDEKGNPTGIPDELSHLFA